MDGVSVRVGAITQSDATVQATGIGTVLAQNASVEISEKSGIARYPALLVYCDKMSNTLKEKFRRFSGRAHLVIEVRHTQDRLDSIEANLQVYVDAVCALLDEARGDWGAGSFYTGGYEVSYEPVARGGINFLQRAKVGFDVEVSK
jgi:hypothetical protein